MRNFPTHAGQKFSEFLETTVQYPIRKGHISDRIRVLYRSVGLEEKFEGRQTQDSYFWTIFSSMMIKHFYKSQEELKKILAEEMEKEMPSHLPPDGSRGQWRIAHQYRIESLQIMIGEYESATA